MKSEFATLSDMVLARGIAHSTLITEIHEAVLSKFREKYPKLPWGVSVIADETTGEIKIFSDGKDITPPEFEEEAKSTARMVLIEKLGSMKEKHATIPLPNVKTMSYPVGSWVSSIIFWGYNIYFLLYALIRANSWLTYLFSNGRFWVNLVNINIAEVFTMFVMAATPLAAMGIVIRQKQSHMNMEKGRVFFLGELPVLAVTFLLGAIGANISLFIQLLIISLLGIPISLYFYTARLPRADYGRKIILFIQTLALITTSYITLLFSFVVPLAVGLTVKEILYGIFSSYGTNYTSSIFQSSTIFLLSLLGLGIVLLFSSLPYLLVNLLSKALDKTSTSINDRKLQAIMVGIVLGIAGLTFLQPQGNKLLDSLALISETQSFMAQENLAKQLIPNENKLKSAIENYEKNRNKYLFGKNDSWLENGYESLLGSDVIGVMMQTAFTGLAYPLVYQGQEHSEYSLNMNYKYLFGHYTYEKTAPAPSQTNTVKLAYRKYSLVTNPDGLAGKISIEEEFENTSPVQQEVIYEFGLPEGAVVTDLNLGPNLEYPGVIAPKGAAQQTYQAQLQVRRDPALLEQTGPDRYRLRIFPIPGNNDFSTLKGLRQKVQYAYVTPLGKTGYKLPVFYKSTNVIASNATTYLSQINNEAIKLTNENPDSLGQGIEWCNNTIIKNIAWTGLAARVSTEKCEDDSNITQGIQGKRIGILMDVAAGSKEFKNDDQIRKLGSEFIDNNFVDLYKYNQYLSDPVRLTSKNLPLQADTVYFGTGGTANAWRYVKQKYDVLFIITAEGTDLVNSNWYPFSNKQTVYLISSKQSPTVNNQLMTYLWEGNGGYKRSINEALADWISKQGKVNTMKMGVLSIELSSPGSGGDYLAAVGKPASGSANIDYAMINGALLRMSLKDKYTDVSGNITEMDKLNKFAKTAGIVTPYSSYIALVNQAQQQQLEQFSQSYNRYQEQTMIQNNNPQVMNPMPTVGFGALRNPFGTSFNSLDLAIPNAPDASFGGGSTGKIMNPSIGASQYGSISTWGIGNVLSEAGFVLLNAGVLGIGLAVYLMRLLRRVK